ncbi:MULTISPECIES: hypothetical protein [Mycobacteriaceae]|uniref:Uncharacterized protein n=1 Tax=Mycolicibacterium neoaurum VKM Ac-1815D TaxID=700508 RepID=V5XJ52_MYCNE|nr:MULTISPECIES: hypothetical protein [Mycobacteriaceae]AMO07727.1 hypothetical protein MyAD_24145 [Mycolicibacterium neoaurum]KJQ51678.1 hypothetical protein TS71_02725 [Mycolicibacterium neoaurum]
MEISARPYFKAGVALTAASAIALTPLMVPTEGRTFAIPKVSTAEVQLAAVINPADVDRLIAALRTGLADITTGIGSVETFTTDTLAGALAEAQRLNTGFWDPIVAAAGTGVLGSLVTAVSNYSQASLAMTAESINGVAGSTVTLPGDITNIIGSTLIGSLNTALYAITDVINNPFKLSSYTGLLAGVVNIIGDALVGQDPNHDTGLLSGPAGTNSILSTALIATLGGVVGTVGLGFSGITGQVNLAVDSLNAALDTLAQQSGSQLLTGVVGLIQGLAINPIKIINNAGVLNGLVDIGFPLLGAVSPITDATAKAVIGVQNGLNVALDAIGSNPLDLASYTTALGGLFNGGFDVTGAGITIGTSLLTTPGNVLAGVTKTTAGLVTELTTNLAATVAAALTQIGLGQAAELVVNLGAAVNTAVNSVRDIVADNVIGGINGVITNISTGLNGVNENARTIIDNLLNYHPVAPAGATADSLGAGPEGGEVAASLVSSDATNEAETQEAAASEEKAAVTEESTEESTEELTSVTETSTSEQDSEDSETAESTRTAFITSASESAESESTTDGTEDTGKTAARTNGAGTAAPSVTESVSTDTAAANESTDRSEGPDRSASAGGDSTD